VHRAALRLVTHSLIAHKACEQHASSSVTPNLQAQHGYGMVRKWVDESEGLLSLHPVEATALAFVR
jgi:hypothetical protein